MPGKAISINKHSDTIDKSAIVVLWATKSY